MAGDELAPNSKVGLLRAIWDVTFGRSSSFGTRMVSALGALCGVYLVSELIGDFLAAKRARKYREYLAKMHVDKKDWREEELRPYDGQDPEKPILIGVDGDVFNVWRGRNFYGAEGPYNEFAGKDATRLLAKQIIEPEEDDGEPLTAMERENLENWKGLFSSKYEHVGALLAQR
eukprot:TRINITY_DN63971_c0_g1_i1.p1 TRINITY_DN63971_c0_g1~~TRINITY_DN63971_c0_g1_i1.p1  ORF type:complete len:186 (+),score=35.62 TRINITY_DN63971_c0_g1_i1:37-558(+)